MVGGELRGSDDLYHREVHCYLRAIVLTSRQQERETRSGSVTARPRASDTRCWRTSAVNAGKCIRKLSWETAVGLVMFSW
eukprot:781646-Amphidinium_carterae.2